ncbi:disease resistance protein RGA4 isoform X2 [Triticum aestivum]|uniref:disease resistance protein RGA4 isoform X2 n=1 Tax=Triticum aestivum TaxID=4565 RepID=UPI001D02398F|nr:disease resistance protein RGA4-like isoform X2 [Triticum aestivum]
MVSPVAPIVGNILTLITLLQHMSHQNHSLQGKIVGKFGSLRVEVESAECNMANYKDDDESMLEMQELLLDIQDYLCDLHIPEKLDALFLVATGTDSRAENIGRIDSFLASIDNVNKRRDERAKEAASKPTILTSMASRSKAPTLYVPEKDLEGFTNSKKEFMDLISLAKVGQLRLISIVGCNGLGKTALARAVYDDVGLPSPATPKNLGESDNQPPEPLEEKTTKEIFDCRAWVVASTFNDMEALLNEVLKEFCPNAAGANTSKALNDYLADKRYMVVIDDLQSDRVRWKDIKHVFPENNKGSRVIVTTSVHSIARDYSSGCYYVYPMQCLSEANSESLFWKKVLAPNTRGPTVPEVERSKIILAKCDGLPLALVSACNYPCRAHKDQSLCEDRYRGMCHELDNIVASNEIDFDDMKRMFVQCYNNLTDYDHKNCLLYLSIYPRGHEINSKSAVRKLKGEELVAGDALKCWKRLIDNSLIEPAPIRNNCSVAKRCKVQGMMREFTINKSISRNLVTLVEGDEVRRIQPHRTVRRLSVRSSSSNEGGSNLIPHEIETKMSTVRSLTVFTSNHPGETYVNDINFRSCKMMRVLDLEGCKGLSSTVVDVICELLFLNYLSLRKTDVNELPTKMKKLERLETLDIRQTRVAILPVEVIMMKDLARLFGEFQLPALADAEKEALTNFLKQYSKLHTLAGIVINNTQGFEIIQHAKNLKKVRICGNKDDSFAASAPTGSKLTSFLSKKKNKNTDVAATSAPISPPSVRRDKTPFWSGIFSKAAKPTSKACYINNKLVEQTPPSTRPNGEWVAGAATQRESKRAKISPGVLASLVFSLQKRSTALHSISIDSAGISNFFLASNSKPRIAKSIKLRGPLTSLTPGTLKDLRNLRKLHLIETGLSSQILVEALQSLECLEYLKLGEEDRSGAWNGDFSVQSGGFSALRDLCFEGAKQYPRLKIAQGAMHVLTSLQLLCEKSPPLMGVDGIEHLTCLDEVILHYSADDATVQAWKEAASEHTNKPCVKKQPNADEPINNTT